MSGAMGLNLQSIMPANPYASAAAGAAGGLAAASPWGAALGAAGSVATAALNDKTNMTNQAAIGAVTTMFGDHNVNLGAGSIGTTKSQSVPASSGIGSPLSTLSSKPAMSNPLILVALAGAAYFMVKK